MKSEHNKRQTTDKKLKGVILLFIFMIKLEEIIISVIKINLK